MEDKKNLRNRCEQCQEILDVAEFDESDIFGRIEGSSNKVRWRTDPLRVELSYDYTRKWLCDYCAMNNSYDV